MVAGVKGKARKKVPAALLDALAQGLDDGAKPLVVLLRDMLAAVEGSLADLERRIVTCRGDFAGQRGGVDFR